MTVPLKYNVMETALQQTTSEEFALFRYNLRLRYATQVLGGGTGAIGLLGGTTTTNIGAASNTERTRVQSAPHPHSPPGASTGTLTRQSYTYGQNRDGVPANPADFTNSYAQFTSTGTNSGNFLQERDINRILDFIINPCIEDMRNGDEVGTYRVSVSTPLGGGWVMLPTIFFRDSIYLNGGGTDYRLWLRTSAANTLTDLPEIFRVVPQGFRQQPIGRSSPFENFVYPLLVNRLNTGSLRYNLSTTQAGISRGGMIDTRFLNTTTLNQRFSADDYRTTVTPAGPAASHQQYFLGLA